MKTGSCGLYVLLHKPIFLKIKNECGFLYYGMVSIINTICGRGTQECNCLINYWVDHFTDGLIAIYGNEQMKGYLLLPSYDMLPCDLNKHITQKYLLNVRFIIKVY
jgi:hypothetical protein